MSGRKPGNNRVLVITRYASNFVHELRIVWFRPGGVFGCLNEISDGVSPRESELLKTGVKVGGSISGIGSREVCGVAVKIIALTIAHKERGF
jgi:hypothetical protein